MVACKIILTLGSHVQRGLRYLLCVCVLAISCSRCYFFCPGEAAGMGNKPDSSGLDSCILLNVP